MDPDLSSYTTVLTVGQPSCDECGKNTLVCIFNKVTPSSILWIVSELCSVILAILYPPKQEKCHSVDALLVSGSATAFNHSGRILGLHFHNSNPDLLYAADCQFGLIEINIQLKTVKVLVPQDQHDNEDVPFIHLSNSLAVLPNGSIFFTDSSSKFKVNDSIFDILEGRGNGQLLHYNPAEEKVHIVSSGLHFPNGICLSHDANSLLISELSRARILRYVHFCNSIVTHKLTCRLILIQKNSNGIYSKFSV